MFEGVVHGNDPLPEEFDEVTSEIKYPPLTEKTTEEEFLKKAGNGYLGWVIGAGIAGGVGFALFVWGVYQLVA